MGKVITDEALGIDRISSGLTDFSASRLATASRCGLAFEYQYIRKLPAPYDRGATMFGNVVHDGLAEWYGPDDAPADYTNTPLAPVILAQWERVLPPVVWNMVQELRELDAECDAVASAILFKRPQLKSPRMTKEFLESTASREFSEKKAKMVELCDALEEVKWPKDEDPYVAYRKSAEIAGRMQVRWQKLPRPLAVERPFAIEVEGFRVRGRIDQYRADPMPSSGEALLCMVDVKTGRQIMTQMEAFLQSFLYYRAIQSFDDLPNLPTDRDNIAFYHARSDKYQQGRIDERRHRRLASRILNGRARQIAMGQFEPSYGMWCKMCDFKDICSNEISMWKDEGITVELMGTGA